MDTILFKRIHKNKKSVSVGRGGTRGKTSGRGTKGQKARSGHKIRPEIRDFIKRIPKLRGRGKNSNRSIVEKPLAVSLTAIDGAFTAGEQVNPSTLRLKGLIRYRESSSAPVKILGGEISKKFEFSNVLVSMSAKTAIEKSGGTIKFWKTEETPAPAAEPKKEEKKEAPKATKKTSTK